MDAWQRPPWRTASTSAAIGWCTIKERPPCGRRLQNVRSCQPMPGEIARTAGIRRIAATYLGTRPERTLLIEVATYPERRGSSRPGRPALAYSALGHCRTRDVRTSSQGSFASETITRSAASSLSQLEARWRTVELWTLLGENSCEADVGIVPWVPLMQFDGRRTRAGSAVRRIEREAEPSSRPISCVAQVMAGCVPGLVC